MDQFLVQVSTMIGDTSGSIVMCHSHVSKFQVLHEKTYLQALLYTNSVCIVHRKLIAVVGNAFGAIYQ